LYGPAGSLVYASDWAVLAGSRPAHVGWAQNIKNRKIEKIER